MDYEEVLPKEEQKGSGKFNLFKLFFYYIIIGFLGWNFFYFIFTSTWFNIKEVYIAGNGYLSNETVIIQGGIKFHTNLFHFNSEKTNANLLSNPWIADVSIKKVFPDQLNIKLLERKPGVLLSYENRFYLVSEEGMILSVLEELNNDFDLYIITGLNIGTKKPGEVIESQEYRNTQRIIYALENIFPDQFYKIQVISTEEHLLFHKMNQIKVRIENGDQLINEWYLLERAMQKVIQEEIPLQEINMKYKERLSIILRE